ncbi:hypothetical protein [Thiococcus pfennigii]|uniref:hypothetical protein n=1 Tax=Thiococcus pfennigii TaxID=1057 RepID=UPI00190725D0|nr:hypothetical protein [Thiococcus pfennigii]
MIKISWHRLSMWLFWLLFCVALALLALYGLDSRKQVDLISVSSTFATVSATLFGFIVAGLSVLSSLMDKKLLKNMRRTGHFGVLLRELYYAAMMFLGVLITSLITFFVDEKLLKIGISASVFLMSLGVVTLIKSGRKFHLIISVID